MYGKLSLKENFRLKSVFVYNLAYYPILICMIFSLRSLFAIDAVAQAGFLYLHVQLFIFVEFSWYWSILHITNINHSIILLEFLTFHNSIKQTYNNIKNSLPLSNPAHNLVSISLLLAFRYRTIYVLQLNNINNTNNNNH